MTSVKRKVNRVLFDSECEASHPIRHDNPVAPLQWGEHTPYVSILNEAVDRFCQCLEDCECAHCQLGYMGMTADERINDELWCERLHPRMTDCKR